MNYEEKLQALREQYKTASIPMREIIKRQARAIKLAQEKSKPKPPNPQDSFL